MVFTVVVAVFTAEEVVASTAVVVIARAQFCPKKHRPCFGGQGRFSLSAVGLSTLANSSKIESIWYSFDQNIAVD